MSIIARAAHFLVCPGCGHHGSIHLSDGRKTSTILSKEAAHGSVDGLLSAGHITSEEALVLRQQIDASDLLEEASILDYILGEGGGVTLLDRDADDTKHDQRAHFFRDLRSPGQNGNMTMH